MTRALCRLSDIVDGDAKLFDNIEGRKQRPELFVVRRGEDVYCYVNDCPHSHITLDVVPGRFMNKTAGIIQCANHGARFEITTGKCIWGPCLGKMLQSKPIKIVKGMIVLKETETVDAVSD